MYSDVFEYQERSIISPISQMATLRPWRIKLAKSSRLGEGEGGDGGWEKGAERWGESGRKGDGALGRLFAKSLAP